MESIVKEMWNEYNDVPYEKLEIKEMSLTGNMELFEMLSRKIEWKTIDDQEHKFKKSKVDLGVSGETRTMIKLEP